MLLPAGHGARSRAGIELAGPLPTRGPLAVVDAPPHKATLGAVDGAPASSTPSVTGQVVRAIRRSAVEREWKLDAWLQDAGIPAEAGTNPRERVARSAFARLWRRIERESGDAAIAFEVGSSTPFGTYDVIDSLIQTAETVHGALDALTRAYRLIHDPTVVTLERDATRGIWRYEVTNDLDGYSRYAVDLVFSTVVGHLRAAAEVDLSPVQINLLSDRRASRARYEAFFRGPVGLGCQHAELQFSAETLDRPLPRANPMVHRVLQGHVALLLGALPSFDRLDHRAREAVRMSLASGRAPQLDEVAAQLAMSARTLQRRLKAERTSFGAIADDARRESALRLLGDAHRSISEVAFQLGFSDVSAFHRAFRRWTGLTPGEHRAGGLLTDAS